MRAGQAQTTGQTQNARTALNTIERKHSQFEIVRTVYINFSRQDAVARMQAAPAAHPDATVIASIYSELTKGAIQVLEDRGTTTCGSTTSVVTPRSYR